MRAVRLVFHASRHGFRSSGMAFRPAHLVAMFFLPFLCSYPPRTEIEIHREKKARIRFFPSILFHTPVCNFSMGIPSTLIEDTFESLPLVCSSETTSSEGALSYYTDLPRVVAAVGCFAAGLLFIPRCFGKDKVSWSTAGINRPRASDLCKVWPSWRVAICLFIVSHSDILSVSIPHKSRKR